MTILLDGKKLREKKYVEFKKRVNILKKNDIKPKLVVVSVGDDPASKIYVSHKERACSQLEISSEIIKLPLNTTFVNLKEVIEKLNHDDQVDGILLQLPLPQHLLNEPISLLINPKKDVDGLHPQNQGIISSNQKIFAPISCTPNGIMEFFKEYNISLTGKNVVIIGRSNIVGKPLSILLINQNATVTMVHTKTTPDTFKDLIKQADIIVSAAGIKDTIVPDQVKNGVVIVDVGIIRTGKKLRGDVEYKSFFNKASYITPVPGGVGPMTVTMLMNNVITLAEKYRLKKNDGN